jgi:acetyl-CoA carboxylase, biotin carboxylase subunit
LIKKILIANRGEIAVRVIRTCKEMGIKTVAVYSDADRISPHVLLADEAYYIGKSPSIESYLNVNKILTVINKSGVDAVHPGYGFLSENVDFATTIQKSGIIWIGAPVNAIKTMGDKVEARQVAKNNSVSLIPGTIEPIENNKDIEEIAEAIGYPMLVKAVGGGGGKGMRIVYSKTELVQSIKRASSEAGKAFSDSRVYLEKYLEDPHHIEIQILSDTHGNHLSLGERECSIQRRFQKIIEETPSPFIDNALRNELSDSAIKLAKACNYIGAGTVEFLVDKHKKWYFLEMNTRLQVEHPITEVVNGIDLVREQINIANGQPISFTQNELKPRGHAIECRIYAEDGLNNFQPSVGKIIDYYPPSGPGIRMDEGFIKGQEITPFYDPMLAKLVVWSNNRQEAISKMDRVLGEMKIVGITTSIPICKEIINHSSFKSGNYCTHTLETILPEIIKHISKNIPPAIASLVFKKQYQKKGKIQSENASSPWAISGREEGLE